ncbi:MAG: insulinase family protein, partial [Candidatus Omnitrophica bacterium]|nr:insulinase family protein [Candidatus Omnitrophota bacterium]
GSYSEIKPLSEKDLSAKIDNIFLMPKEQTLFALGFRGVTVKNEDRYGLEVISSIMSGSDGRIFHSVRNNLGLSYAQGAGQVAGVDPGYFFFYLATDKKDLNKAKELVLAEISRIKKEPLPDAELSAAKNSLIGDYLISMQTNSAKAFTMALDELYSLGFDNHLKYNENIEKYSKSDIIKLANTYFDLNKSCSVTIEPE